MGTTTSSFSIALQAARCTAGLSQSQAARACNLSDTQIAGLESDQYQSFYSPAYARKAAGAYSAFLGVHEGLPPALLPPPVETLTPATLAVEPAAMPLRLKLALPRRAPAWLVTGAVAAVCVGAAMLLPRPALTQHVANIRPAAPLPAPGAATSGAGVGPAASVTPAAPANDAAVVAAAPAVAMAATPAPAPETAAPARESAAPAPEAAASGTAPSATAASPAAGNSDEREGRLFVALLRDTQVRVTDSSGKVLMSGLEPAGTHRRIIGTPPFYAVTNNPDATLIYYLRHQVHPQSNRRGQWRAVIGRS